MPPGRSARRPATTGDHTGASSGGDGRAINSRLLQDRDPVIDARQSTGPFCR
jgi:hypothetical protein